MGGGRLFGRTRMQQITQRGAGRKRQGRNFRPYVALAAQRSAVQVLTVRPTKKTQARKPLSELAAQVPASAEAWLWENPAALASVMQGLRESAEGKLVYRGSFANWGPLQKLSSAPTSAQIAALQRGLPATALRECARLVGLAPSRLARMLHCTPRPRGRYRLYTSEQLLRIATLRGEFGRVFGKGRQSRRCVLRCPVSRGVAY